MNILGEKSIFLPAAEANKMLTKFFFILVYRRKKMVKLKKFCSTIGKLAIYIACGGHRGLSFPLLLFSPAITKLFFPRNFVWFWFANFAFSPQGIKNDKLDVSKAYKTSLRLLYYKY